MQSQWNAAKALVCYPIVRQRAKIWYQKTTSKPNFRNWLHRNHFCPSALACVCVALAVDKPCLDLRNHILVQLVWHFHAGLQKHSFQLVSLSIMYTAMQRQSAPSSTPSSWHTRTISCRWNLLQLELRTILRRPHPLQSDANEGSHWAGLIRCSIARHMHGNRLLCSLLSHMLLGMFGWPLKCQSPNFMILRLVWLILKWDCPCGDFRPTGLLNFAKLMF